VLGAAETVVGLSEAFKPVPDKRGLYRPNDVRAAPARVLNINAAAMPKLVAMAGP
jgi:chemotaxis protein methyltransferase CheR